MKPLYKVLDTDEGARDEADTETRTLMKTKAQATPMTRTGTGSCAGTRPQDAPRA